MTIHFTDIFGIINIKHAFYSTELLDIRAIYKLW